MNYSGLILLKDHVSNIKSQGSGVTTGLINDFITDRNLHDLLILCADKGLIELHSIYNNDLSGFKVRLEKILGPVLHNSNDIQIAYYLILFITSRIDLSELQLKIGGLGSISGNIPRSTSGHKIASQKYTTKSPTGNSQTGNIVNKWIKNLLRKQVFSLLLPLVKYVKYLVFIIALVVIAIVVIKFINPQRARVSGESFTDKDICGEYVGFITVDGVPFKKTLTISVGSKEYYNFKVQDFSNSQQSTVYEARVSDDKIRISEGFGSGKITRKGRKVNLTKDDNQDKWSFTKE